MPNKTADDAPRLSIEEKVVFAAVPNEDGSGPLIIVGIPKGAWEYMADGKTHNFDLTRLGLPLKFMLFGAGTHDDVMSTIQEMMKTRGQSILDLRRESFGIKPKEG